MKLLASIQAFKVDPNFSLIKLIDKKGFSQPTITNRLSCKSYGNLGEVKICRFSEVLVLIEFYPLTRDQHVELISSFEAELLAVLNNEEEYY